MFSPSNKLLLFSLLHNNYARCVLLHHIYRQTSPLKYIFSYYRQTLLINSPTNIQKLADNGKFYEVKKQIPSLITSLSLFLVNLLKYLDYKYSRTLFLEEILVII